MRIAKWLMQPVPPSYIKTDYYFVENPEELESLLMAHDGSMEAVAAFTTAMEYVKAYGLPEPWVGPLRVQGDHEATS